jgi:hypothetical protein
MSRKDLRSLPKPEYTPRLMQLAREVAKIHYLTPLKIGNSLPRDNPRYNPSVSR